jgi:hypothetical protein
MLEIEQLAWRTLPNQSQVKTSQPFQVCGKDGIDRR